MAQPEDRLQIVLRDGMFIRETTVSQILGTEAAVLTKFAFANTFKDLGPIFSIPNKFQELFPDTPNSFNVTVMEEGAKRIFRLEMDFIPWFIKWKLEGNISLVPYIGARNENEPSTVGLIDMPTAVKIPRHWGKIYVVFETDKDALIPGSPGSAYLQHANTYVVFAPNKLLFDLEREGDFDSYKYLRMSLPNMHPGGRVCMGDLTYQNTSSLAASKDLPANSRPQSEFIEYLFEYLWTSRFNRDLGYNITWISKDIECNDIPLEKNTLLLERARDINSISVTTTQDKALLGLIDMFSLASGGTITRDKKLYNYLPK